MLWANQRGLQSKGDGCSSPKHVHFQTLQQLVDFILLFQFTKDFVEDDRLFQILYNILKLIKEPFKESLPKYIDKGTLMAYTQIIAKGKTIVDFFESFLSSRLNFELFPSNLTVMDKGFQLTCKHLCFLKLNEILPLRNSERIEKNLKTCIRQLRKISSILSYKSIIKTFKEVMNKIVGVITSANLKSAGNEELLPTMIYCIIKA